MTHAAGSVYRSTLRRAASGHLRPAPVLLAAALFLLHLPVVAAQAPAASQVGAASRVERKIGPGVRLLRWTSNENPAGPFAFAAVEVDADQPFIQLGVSLGKGTSLALEPLSLQAERMSRPNRYPIAGVNGDFFLYPDSRQGGIPTNAAVIDDEVVHTPYPRSCLVVPRSAAPRIEVIRANSTVTLPGSGQRNLEAVNHPLGGNQLVLFTPWYGPSTRTPAESTEVFLEPEQFPLKHGFAHRARVRAVQHGAGNAPIAPGAWVLSGSGPAGALLRNLAPGSVVDLRVDFDPALAPGDQVIGGGPRLVREGKVSVERESGRIGDSFVQARHPRTAIGYRGRKLYLVTVDGRQPGHSIGMTLPELAQAMLDLGCTDAVNMDGGGSTTLWARGAIINRPSDGRERAVANGLLVFSTAPKGDAVRVVPQSDSVAALLGAEVPLAAVGEDTHYNPVPVPPHRLLWSVTPGLGQVRDGRFIAGPRVVPDPGQEFASGKLVATLAGGPEGARGEVAVRVYPKPARVEVSPALLKLGTGVRQNFRVRALDAQGRPLLLPPLVTWTATPEAGEIGPTGILATGAASGRGTVTAILNGVIGTAQVEVAEGFSPTLDDFERSMDWKSRLAGGAGGQAKATEGPARSGKRALRLEYDFSRGMGTRALYADASRKLGTPVALKLWLHGDGQGAWVRVRIKDAKGAFHTLDAARNVTWKDEWRELRVPLSEDFLGPLSLESIYVVEADGTRKTQGTLWIDDLGVEQ